MTSFSTVADRQTSFGRLPDLPLTVESYGLDGLRRRWSAEFVRRTTVVRLSGAGQTGVGDDVTYTPADHEVLQAAGATLPLAGRYTLDSFFGRLEELELFAVQPRRADSRPHRRWAFESAALDLALRQSGLSLASALDRRPAPVSLVVSLRLPEPPTAESVLARLKLYPGLRFKLDATASWTESLVAGLAATGAVASIDFKAYYEDLPVDGAVDPSLASLFHPDAPNDVASLGYHEIRDGLPRSPLAPSPTRSGFRWSA